MTRGGATALLAVAVFLGLPAVVPGWMIFLLTLALAKSVVVLAIALLLRGGLVSFGHGIFFATGAYGVGLSMKWLHVQEALALAAIGVLAATAVAALLGLFIARYRGIFFAMLNMAISMVVYALLLKLYWVTGGTDGLGIRTASIAGWVPDRHTLRPAIYWFTLALTVAAFVLVHRFWHSPLGFLLRAVRDNEVRVEYMGLSVGRTIYAAYVLSGALGGLAGVLTGFSVGHIVPEFAYWTTSGEFVFVAVLGGPASIPGPLVGSIVFEFLKSYAYKYAANTWQLTLGMVMLLIILFLPGGIWTLVQGRGGRAWRRSSKQPA
jgi:branched-chain amino acid transport system permease protein